MAINVQALTKAIVSQKSDLIGWQELDALYATLTNQEKDFLVNAIRANDATAKGFIAEKLLAPVMAAAAQEAQEYIDSNNPLLPVIEKLL